MSVKNTSHINRSQNLEKYLEGRGWKKALSGEKSKFSYWDTYNDKPVQSEIMVWPKTGLSQIVDCLWTWHSRLEKLGLTHLAPKTILDWRREKKQLTREDFSDDELWFFKQIFGVHGKGINIMSTLADYSKFLVDNPRTPVNEFQGPCSIEDLEEMFVLQKCETDTHLLKGRKYILRVYSLTMGNGETYLYNDCLYYSTLFPVKYDNQDCYVGKNNRVFPVSVKDKSGKTFVPKEQMRKNVHVSHWKPEDEGPYNIVDNRLMGVLSDLSVYETVQRNLFQNVREMSLVYDDILQEHSGCADKPFEFGHDKKTYQIWGADYIVLSDLSVKCLEINAFPNLTHGDPYKGTKGGKSRPHELKFRANGFDRDLMRLFDYDLDNYGTKPNNWVLVNKDAMQIPVTQLYLQKAPHKKKKPKKKPKKKKTRRR